MKTALITGICGQDGSYLAEFLLEKGYRVIGISDKRGRTSADFPTHLLRNAEIHEGDICDCGFIEGLFRKHSFDEVYNLAAQSHVGESFRAQVATWSVNAAGAMAMMRLFARQGGGRFYQASSSEMFGNQPRATLDETAPFAPISPYGASKLAAHQQLQALREATGQFFVGGLLFNHESPRRDPRFVTRKLTSALVALVSGAEQGFTLGSLDVQRDWGDARDYVQAQWLMLQQEVPKDFVIATGRALALRDLIRHIGHLLGIEIGFRGAGLEETGVLLSADRSARRHLSLGQTLFRISTAALRPKELYSLRGDATCARLELGWVPKIPFETTLGDMVASDMAASTRQVSA